MEPATMENLMTRFVSCRPINAMKRLGEMAGVIARYP